MKNKIKLHIFVEIALAFVVLFSIYSLNSSVIVSAADDVNGVIANVTITEKDTDIKINDDATIDDATIDYICQVFKDKSIKNCNYLYNLDDSADYIIAEFENSGYVIYSKYKMEMLEYNLLGSSPYRNSEVKNYYAGPEKYFYRDNKSRFVSFITGERFDLSQEEIALVSSSIKENIIKKQVDTYNQIAECGSNFESSAEKRKEKSFAPTINDTNLIVASTEKGKLIANYRYFLACPTIGINGSGTYGNGNSGTCGPVAAQILLSYNNYYNNRKIIDDKFLNGYDDTTNTVADLEKNPNYCTGPMTLNSYTTGTRSEGSGANSFYCEMISRIMEPNTDGATTTEVRSGIESYLNTRLSSSEFAINHFVKGKNIFGKYYPVDSSLIKAELNVGRPLIISMREVLGGTNHFVIGYGYQDYTYPDDGGTYSGYVTHYGWLGTKKECIWINSSWCDGYLSLNINHLHRYYQHQNEYRCSLCKHRTDASIYMGLDDRYYEIMANIPQNNYAYKDFYVVFSHEGQKLFQTFGKKSVKMSLYDSQYNLLVHDEQNNGYGLNPFFYYNVSADVVYYLRIALKSETDSGRVKIGVTPASEVYDNYAAIDNLTTDSSCTLTYSPTRFTTKVLTFTAQSAGKYTFETHYVGAFAATCLYLVDPASPNECDFDCDSGEEELQGYLRRTLAANKKYFIVVSLYNPSSTECDRIKLTIKKVS